MHISFKSVTKIKRISPHEHIDLLYHCLSLISLGPHRCIYKLYLVIPGGRQASLTGVIPRRPWPIDSWPSVSLGPTWPIYIDCVSPFSFSLFLFQFQQHISQFLLDLKSTKESVSGEPTRCPSALGPPWGGGSLDSLQLLLQHKAMWPPWGD